MLKFKIYIWLTPAVLALAILGAFALLVLLQHMQLATGSVIGPGPYGLGR